MSQVGIINSLLAKECEKYKINQKNIPKKKPVAKKRKTEGRNKIKPSSPEISGNNKEELQLINTHNLSSSTESSKVTFPHITKSNWKAFNEKLFNENLDTKNTKIKVCLNKMQAQRSENFHFTTCHYIRKAIIDSLLKRDWNILINLLIIFIERYNQPLFMPFIRQICDILQCHHPKIKGTKFDEQLTAIKEKYSNYRNKRKNVLNTV